jgi:hypothetical protein
LKRRLARMGRSAVSRLHKAAATRPCHAVNASDGADTVVSVVAYSRAWIVPENGNVALVKRPSGRGISKAMLGRAKGESLVIGAGSWRGEKLMNDAESVILSLSFGFPWGLYMLPLISTAAVEPA